MVLKKKEKKKIVVEFMVKLIFEFFLLNIKKFNSII